MGIGLGTIVVLLSIAFVVFVIVVLYLCVRTQNRYKEELHIQRFKSVQTSLQSLASPSLTVTSNNNFTLRKKESNVFRNNSSSRRKDTPQPQVPHSHSVNEFVEQPEVYKLDAVNTKKKHLPTPPDSPLLKQHHAPSEATPSSEPPDVKVVEATLECVEDEKREAEVLSSVPSLLERPSRSCLSSVSDSQKIKPEKNVKFVEDGDNQVAPPPPLPPKFQNGDDSSPPPPDDSPDENEDSSLIMPPPRPPKPLIVSSEIQKEESLPTSSGASRKKQCSAMEEEEKVREKEVMKDENMNADNAAGERMNGERFVEGDDSSEDDSSGGNSSSGDDGSSVGECVVELGYTGESERRGEMEAYVYKRLDFDGETRSENSTESSL